MRVHPELQLAGCDFISARRFNSDKFYLKPILRAYGAAGPAFYAGEMDRSKETLLLISCNSVQQLLRPDQTRNLADDKQDSSSHCRRATSQARELPGLFLTRA